MKRMNPSEQESLHRLISDLHYVEYEGLSFIGEYRKHACNIYFYDSWWV